MNIFRHIPVGVETILFLSLCVSCGFAQNSDLPPSLTPAEQEAEKRLGNLESAIMAQSGVILVAPELEKEIQTIADKLSGTSRLDRKVRIFILNMPLANAWSSPNGDIFITTGILILADNRDEVAVLLGHEVAHLYFHDGYERLIYQFSTMKTSGYVTALISAALAGAASSVTGSFMQMVPLHNPALQMLYDKFIVSYAGDMVARFVTNMDAMVASMIVVRQISGYSQSLEFRADRMGLRIAAQAGFDVRRGSLIFNKLANLKSQASRKK